MFYCVWLAFIVFFILPFTRLHENLNWYGTWISTDFPITHIGEQPLLQNFTIL